MTRGKVNLSYIANDSTRKTTFRKRKGSLIKAAGEISTLCGIDGCMIIYRPEDPEPTVWPHQLGTQQVIARFRNLSLLEQNKKMMDQKSFIAEKLEKTKEKLVKQQKVNQHKETSQLMYRCLDGGGFQNLNMGDLNNISDLISQNLKAIDKRIEFLHQNGE